MKKTLFLFVALLGLSLFDAGAVGASPYPIKKKQPDGSTITLRLHGDEYYNWYTTVDGNTIYDKGADGWWRPSRESRSSRNARMMKARQQREEHVLTPTRSSEGGICFGEKNFLVLLVEWKDKSFHYGAGDYFRRALNEEGFSDFGGAGSVADYYKDASYGMFNPTFDVYGPIAIDRGWNEFPEGDDNRFHLLMVEEMITGALEKLGDDIDYSKYDNDNDGYIDNVYLFFPGLPQSSGYGEDLIWPHKSWMYSDPIYGGKRLGSYACSSEFVYESDIRLSKFAGIGTFCHEFGHVLGLPDLYDTDYEDNGQANHPGAWNLMASGSYNGDGRIPPSLSTFERHLLGFIGEMEDIGTVGGNKTVPNLSEGRGCKLPTSNDGEYFLVEVRDGKKWDSPLQKGMLIYHVDRSDNIVGGRPAYQMMNTVASHPCYYLVSPDEAHTNFIYPGTNPVVRALDLKSWSGHKEYSLSSISYNDAASTASFTSTGLLNYLKGRVKDAETGKAIEGAVVIVSEEATTKANMRSTVRTLQSARKDALYETTTDKYGKFIIDIEPDAPEVLSVSIFAPDYIPEFASVSGKYIDEEFTLKGIIKGKDPASFSKAPFPIVNGLATWGTNEPGSDYSVAIHYTVDELRDYVGYSLSKIQFTTDATGEEVYVFVDFGTEQRALLQRVYNVSNTVSYDAPVNTVDVYDAGIVIPEDTDIYIGYTIKSANSGNPICLTFTDDEDAESGREGLLCRYDSFTGNEPTGIWYDYSEWGYIALIAFDLVGRTSLDGNASLDNMGISYIDIPASGLKAGDSLPLKLVQSKARVISETAWYMDGRRCNGDSVTLTSGKHRITVEITYHDGQDDIVEKIINVE